MLSACPIGCCTVGVSGMNSDLLSMTCLSLLLNTSFSCERARHELLSSWAEGDCFEIKSLAMSVGELLLLLVLLDTYEK